MIFLFAPRSPAHTCGREKTLLCVQQTLSPFPPGCTAKLHFPAPLAVGSCDCTWANRKWEEVMHSPCWKMMTHEKLPCYLPGSLPLSAGQIQRMQQRTPRPRGWCRHRTEEAWIPERLYGKPFNQYPPWTVMWATNFYCETYRDFRVIITAVSVAFPIWYNTSVFAPNIKHWNGPSPQLG